jgi:glycosyltransferase involved in cell wall biosynthesis
VQGDWPKCCAVIIPCLNERDTIGALVHQVRNYLPKVIVVDDGSTDETASLAEEAGAEVLRLPTSLGKGAALLEGWRLAANAGFAWALNMDGDGQHDPADIPAFFAGADAETPALVIGDRMRNPVEMPWVRRHVNRWMSARISRRLGLSLPDSQCGFRLMHLPSLLQAGITARRYEIESEIIVAASRKRLPVSFVPIRVIYKHGGSKINAVTDTVRWFRWFWSANGQ